MFTVGRGIKLAWFEAEGLSGRGDRGDVILAKVEQKKGHLMTGAFWKYKSHWSLCTNLDEAEALKQRKWID